MEMGICIAEGVNETLGSTPDCDLVQEPKLARGKDSCDRFLCHLSPPADLRSVSETISNQSSTYFDASRKAQKITTHVSILY